MTWSFSATGRLADPDEEDQVLQKCQEFMNSMAQIEQSVTSAKFTGSYGSEDLMPEGEGEVAEGDE